MEDNYLDVIDKARMGAGLSEVDLLRSAGITQLQWHALRGGELVEDVLRRVSQPLRLDAASLGRLARDEYDPAVPALDGLRRFESAHCVPGYPELHVNAYVAWDPASRAAAIFDTGSDAAAMLAHIDSTGLELRHIFLTHTHPDHIAALDELLQGTGKPPVHVHSSERRPGMLSIEAGSTVQLGALAIQVRLTPGHSPGGLTYVVDGLKVPVAVVGDALYAGSAGGARQAWRGALAAVQREILTLPPDTVICPGHGPLTTVAYERANNPLFAGQR